MVLNGDTVAVMTIPQVKFIDKAFLKLKFEEAQNDTLNEIIKSFKTETQQYKDVIGSYKKMLEFNTSLVNEDDKQLRDYQLNENQRTRQNKVLKIERDVFFVAAVALAVKVFIIK